MGVMYGRPTASNDNNQSCIKMCENPVMQKRTQHIAVKCHYVLEQGEDESVELQFCPTEIMEADLLTKALSKTKVDQRRQTLMSYSLTLEKSNSVWVGCWGQKTPRPDRLNYKINLVEVI